MPDNSTADTQRRYSWYANFLKQAGVAPRPFDDWLRLYKSDPSHMDVSPQSTTVDKAANAVPADGQIEKNATGEATYEIQRQASSPWEGFWQDFFKAARNSGEPEAPPMQEPSPDQYVAPTEKLNRILVGLLSTMFDEYTNKQRTLSDLTKDFDRALRQQALAKGFDAALERHQLIEQMSDALDHEALKNSLAAMLEARMGTPSGDHYELEDIADYKLEPMKFDKNPWESDTSHKFSVGGTNFTAIMPMENSEDDDYDSSGNYDEPYSEYYRPAQATATPKLTSPTGFGAGALPHPPQLNLQPPKLTGQVPPVSAGINEQKLGKPRWFMFTDDKRGSGITGAGHAADVFRYATGLLLAGLSKHNPEYMQFSAAEPSRQKLYRQMASRIERHNPNYTAFEATLKGEPSGNFYLVHKDAKDKLSQISESSNLRPLGTKKNPASSTSESQYTAQSSDGNGKWHPKHRFEKQLYDVLCRQFGTEQYSAEEQVDLDTEPDKYPELAEYAIQAEQPDQYAGLFNPLSHPRGNVGNPGQFTKKVGPDPDMLGSADEDGGPGGGGDEEPPMPVAPPLPPAKTSVARVDLPDEINNKIQELAAHIPDYLLDGDGRTKDAHVTIKMLADDDPSAIAQLLQDEPPFRAVLGKLTIADAIESRPYDVVKIAVHSPAIQRIHRKLSKALDTMQTTNGYQPFIAVADVQPGTVDRLLGWDGLEGELVIVDSLTFVNRQHEAHKIPLKGKEGEYVLEEPYTSDSQGIERPIAEQYAARRGYRPQHATPLFDRPVQIQSAAAVPATATTPSTPATATPMPSSPPSNMAIGPLFAPKPAATSRPPRDIKPMPSLGPPEPSSTDYTPDEMSSIQREAADIANEISEARRNWQPPEESLVKPEPTISDQGESGNEPELPDDTGSVPNEPEFRSEPNAGGESRRLDTGRAVGLGNRGTRGPRGIKTARAEFMPQSVDTSIVPQSVRGLLRPMQIEDTALAIQAMTKHGGFLNASGTGSGKSYSTLATARYWADNNHKVLIITPNEAINPDYETGRYAGTFHKAGEAMGSLPTLNNGTKPINPGEIHITTYHRFHGLEDQVDDNTIVMWDESHLLKNQDSDRSQTGDRMNQKAKAVLYATATPADKVIHIAHLFRAKVFGNRAAEKTYRELGLVPFDEKNDDGTVRQSWRIDPDIGPIEVYRRLNGLFNQMTQEGLMVKRDLDMTGMAIYMKHIDFPQRANEILHDIEMEASDGLGIHGMAGIAKGRLLMDLRRQQEPFKVPYITELVKHELKDKGRQVVIYTSRVNPSDVRRGGETLFSSSGTPRLLKKQLETHFDARIGELHGGSDNPPEASMRNFQEGRTNVLIGTMDKAGIGIDLDDQTGERPRTMIIMTAPFAGDRNAQTLGRIWRDSTRSEHGRTNVIYLFANTDIDHWNRDLIAGKMRVLGAVVQGAARDLEIPFDIGEEGLLDLARQNKTERERQRDMIARNQLKEHYQWRQLTGLPQEGPPPAQRQMSVEGLEQLQPGQIGYKQKGEAQKRVASGPKRQKTILSSPGQTTMFTQDSDPERYTMTSAEIAEAVKSWKEPSKAQIEAENYRKPRVHIRGLEIAIENPRGSIRKKGWKPLAHHYGYCARIAGDPAPEARDGDKVDIFIGPHPESEVVFVVDQEHPSGRYDEPKVLLGFTNMKDARQGYLDNYPSDWHCGPITALTIDQFRAWLETGDTTKRIADQVSKYSQDMDPGYWEYVICTNKDDCDAGELGGISDGEISRLRDAWEDLPVKDQQKWRKDASSQATETAESFRRDPSQEGWIGVDLDGTLAYYDKWRGVEHIGKPIAAMIERVKKWLDDGKDVRIVTARVAPFDPSSGGTESDHDDEVAIGRKTIERWCKDHIGRILPITSRKDHQMTELWDDRAVEVEQNTGKPVSKKHDKYAAKYGFEDLHPRNEQNKRFVEKHASLTLAQTIDRPPTPGERKIYDDYVDFLKVGGNKPLPFKDWLKFHRTTKYYQAQKEREDAAKEPKDDEQLIGGKGDYLPDSDFDPNSIKQGMKVESEHTADPEIQREITFDHLSEDPHYYDKLKEVENADSGKSETEDDEDENQTQDSESKGRQDTPEQPPTRLSRHPGTPSKHTLAAVRDFAVSFYSSYYQDKE